MLRRGMARPWRRVRVRLARRQLLLGRGIHVNNLDMTSGNPGKHFRRRDAARGRRLAQDSPKRARHGRRRRREPGQVSTDLCLVGRDDAALAIGAQHFRAQLGRVCAGRGGCGCFGLGRP